MPMTLIGKVIKRRPADLILTAEAAVLLVVFKVCLALLPVRRILGAVTHGRKGEVEAAPSSAAAAAACSTPSPTTWPRSA